MQSFYITVAFEFSGCGIGCLGMGIVGYSGLVSTLFSVPERSSVLGLWYTWLQRGRIG